MKQRLSEAPPPGASTTPSLAPGANATYTLASLLLQLGAVERAQVLAYLAPGSTAKLVDEGGRVNTDLLVREGVRIVGLTLDVLGRADDKQRMLMPALNNPMLACCAAALSTCQSVESKRSGATSRNGAQTRLFKAVHAISAEKVATQRKVIYAAAVSLAGADSTHREDLDKAWGSGDEPAHLADSLGKLVGVTRAIITDARKRGVTVAITDAWLKEQEALAAKLRKQLEGKGTSSDGDVGQGDLEWWRGIAMWFLKQIVDTVDVAHEADPRVKAIPLGALRRVFKRSGKPTRKAKGEPQPNPVAPPTK